MTASAPLPRVPAGGAALSFPVAGLSCASCAGRVERALKALPGAGDVAVNLASARASLRLAGPATPAEAAEAVAAAGYAVPETETVLALEGLSCASCVGRVEGALRAVPGVRAVQVNLANGRAGVRHLDGIVGRADLEAAVARAGYAVAAAAAPDAPPEDRRAREFHALRRDTILAALLALPVVVLDMGGHLVPGFHHAAAGVLGPAGGALIQAAFATLVLAGPGRGFFVRGIPGLLRGHPDMNALVAMGAGAAYLYSLVSTFAPGWLPPGTAHLYFEASVLIVTLILLGRSLEARAKGRAGAAIARLMDLAPRTARVVRDGAEREVPLGELRVGDVVRIRPGERVAADGTVVAGTSSVDESMVTGEPVPVRKAAGDATVGGTLNGQGSFDLRVGSVGADTVLAQIARMVEAAQGAKLPIQALLDRVTGRFVPAVIAVAAATSLLWLALGPEPALGQALVHAIAVLIVACPCAMGLATPTSIMVGTGRAARAGILFRDGTALQRLRDVAVVALDKTGTLTEGRPRLTDLAVLPGEREDEILALAAALETRSEHPLAASLVAAARERGLDLPEPDAFEAVAGHGVRGRVAGRAVAVGAARHLERLGIGPDPALAARAAALADAGRTPVHAAVDGRHVAVLAVADPVKADARAAVAALRANGLVVAMVTGDDRRTAAGVARDLGITEVVAEVLPAGKVEAVQRLRAAHGPVAFVGDGINDAPALAGADVGLAIGTGTDIAVDSADVVLMSGALAGLVEAVALSRAVMANIRQNLFWAFGYNVALVPVAAGLPAAFGGPALSPVLAAGAMALSSVFVVANALRLGRLTLGGRA